MPFGPRPTDPEVRFWRHAHVDPSGCWIWTGAMVKGYGRFWSGRRLMPSHRFMYELWCEPVPLDLDMDHLCRRPACVNPLHVEPVTRRANLLRGNTHPA